MSNVVICDNIVSYKVKVPTTGPWLITRNIHFFARKTHKQTRAGTVIELPKLDPDSAKANELPQARAVPRAVLPGDSNLQSALEMRNPVEVILRNLAKKKLVAVVICCSLRSEIQHCFCCSCSHLDLLRTPGHRSDRAHQGLCWSHDATF